MLALSDFRRPFNFSFKLPATSAAAMIAAAADSVTDDDDDDVMPLWLVLLPLLVRVFPSAGRCPIQVYMLRKEKKR